MLAIFVSFGIGGVVGILLYYFGLSAQWCIAIGIIIFILLQVGCGLFVRKVIKRKVAEIQDMISGGQQKLNKKIQFFQNKPQGGVKSMQKLLEKDQHVFIKQALEATKTFDKLYSWNVLLRKQVNTMKMQFYYQLKDFAKVDELMKKCFTVDSMSISMKMARMYKLGDAGYKKLFYKKAKKYKDEQAVILYALYSWILVKNGEKEEAIKVLEQGKKKTSNEVLTKNWECLVNGKDSKFSNADIGDSWYALYLEEVKVPKVKHQYMRAY